MTDLALRSDHPLWFRTHFVGSGGAGLVDGAVHADGCANVPAAWESAHRAVQPSEAA